MRGVQEGVLLPPRGPESLACVFHTSPSPCHSKSKRGAVCNQKLYPLCLEASIIIMKYLYGSVGVHGALQSTHRQTGDTLLHA